MDILNEVEKFIVDNNEETTDINHGYQQVAEDITDTVETELTFTEPNNSSNQYDMDMDMIKELLKEHASQIEKPRVPKMSTKKKKAKNNMTKKSRKQNRKK